MKKIFLYLTFFGLSIIVNSQPTYKKIALAEYGFYAIGNDSLIYSYKTPGPTFAPYSLRGVTDIAGGMHQAAAVTADGKAWIIIKPSSTGQMVYKQVIGPTDADSVVGLGTTFVFTTKSGAVWVAMDTVLQAQRMQTTGKIIQAAAGDNLYLLNSAGEV